MGSQRLFYEWKKGCSITGLDTVRRPSSTHTKAMQLYNATRFRSSQLFKAKPAPYEPSLVDYDNSKILFAITCLPRSNAVLHSDPIRSGTAKAKHANVKLTKDINSQDGACHAIVTLYSQKQTSFAEKIKFNMINNRNDHSGPSPSGFSTILRPLQIIQPPSYYGKFHTLAPRSLTSVKGAYVRPTV